MIYDSLPIIDVFRAINDDALLGVMEPPRDAAAFFLPSFSSRGPAIAARVS